MTTYLNCGNCFTNSFLDKVIALNEQHKDDIQVKSLFGSLGGLTPTARALDRLPYRKWDFLVEYITKARTHGIECRWTLNQSCLGSIQDFKSHWDKTLNATLTDLHDIGIKEWIVTSPLLIELLRNKFPDDFIEVSTICEVATPDELSRLNTLGANSVNLSTSINRDFTTLKLLKRKADKLGMTLTLLANEACLYRCPWRRDCYNLSSHNSLRSKDLFERYPFQRCNALRLAQPEEWLKARLILPQWLKRYQDLIQITRYKVAFRTHPEEVALPILEAYMNRSWQGNLLELWPTVAQLAHTADPREQTYISCKKLDEVGFLDHFVLNRCVSCADCGFCDRIYAVTQEKDTAL